MPSIGESSSNESQRSVAEPLSNAHPGGSLRRILSLIFQRLDFLSSVAVAFGIVGLQLLQGVLLARLLGDQGRGEYAVAIFLVQLLLYIGLFGGIEIVARYANQIGGAKETLQRSALWLGIVTGCVVMTVAMIASRFVIPADKLYLQPLALLCALSFVGQNVMLIMTAVDRGAGDFRSYNIRRFAAAAAFPLLILVYLPFGKLTVTSACVLYVAASIFSMVVCLYGLKKPFTGERFRSVPRLLGEGKPYALSMLVTDLFEKLDLLLVMWLSPIIVQGYYATMIPVAYPLVIIPNTLGLFLFNEGAKTEQRVTRRSILKILGYSFLVQAVMTAVFMLLVRSVVTFVYGEAFAPAVEIALWLAPVSAIKGMLQGLDGFLKGRGRPIVSIWSRIAAAITMIAVVYWIGPGELAIGIALAALVGQIVCLLWISAAVWIEVGRRDLSAKK